MTILLNAMYFKIWIVSIVLCCIPKTIKGEKKGEKKNLVQKGDPCIRYITVAEISLRWFELVTCATRYQV